ncbi:MAG: hypothetical protein AB7E04_05400 [Desulfobacteraceae bacterium]|jgi:hypothetical protein
MAKRKSTPMTKEALSRIHSTEAKKNGGNVPKNSFTSRAQKAVVKNEKNTD